MSLFRSTLRHDRQLPCGYSQPWTELDEMRIDHINIAAPTISARIPLAQFVKADLLDTHAIPQLGKSIEYRRDEHVAGHPAHRIQENKARALK